MRCFSAREEKKIQLVLFTSDRGLCGGYNANLIRAAEAFMRKNADKEIEITLVGRKGADHYRRRRANIVDRYIGILAKPADELAAEIAREIDRALYQRRDRRGLYSLQPAFARRCRRCRRWKNFCPWRWPRPARAEAQQQTEYLYEPGIQELLASLLPRITDVALQRALLEATASEHGARMTAMDSATTNASKMMGSLTLQMNRARQASITRELMEIVGTAEALK